MISLCCELTAVIVFQKILHFSRIAALFGNIVRSEFIVGTVILAGSGMQKELDCVSIASSGCQCKRSDDRELLAFTSAPLLIRYLTISLLPDVAA